MSRLVYFILMVTIIAIEIKSLDAEEPTSKYKYFSNLSKYEAFRGDIRKSYKNCSECTPYRLYYFQRLGTRYPSTKEINLIKGLPGLRDQIVANYENGDVYLTEYQIEQLKNWNTDTILGGPPLYLAPEGTNETLRLVQRYLEALPSLLNRTYTPQNFYFQHSDTERTAQTTVAYVDGLFGSTKCVEIDVTPLSEDYLLWPFGGACPKLQQIYSLYPYNATTPNQFIQTEAYELALKILSKRLGFTELLTSNDLLAIWAACAYDSAILQESLFEGAWCPALGENAMKAGEYYWDLEFQDQSGYSGVEATMRAGCAPLQDLYRRFSTAVGELDYSDKNQTVAVFISHDVEMMLILTNLGLLEDYPRLTAYDYFLEGHRQWRTSKWVPFIANFAFVLEECIDPKSGAVTYQVQIFQNEKPFTIFPKCPGGVCSWETLKSVLQPRAENCDFSDFC